MEVVEISASHPTPCFCASLFLCQFYLRMEGVVGAMRVFEGIPAGVCVSGVSVCSCLSHACE